MGKLTGRHDGQGCTAEGGSVFTVEVSTVVAIAPAGQRSDVGANFERERFLADFHLSKSVWIESE